MKRVLASSSILFALLLGQANGHGVERGSIAEAIKAALSEQTEAGAKLVSALEERCDLSDANTFSAVAETREETVDQGIRDTVITLEILVGFPDGRDPEKILVEAKEFSVSNPSIDKVEILSIRSRLCR